MSIGPRRVRSTAETVGESTPTRYHCDACGCAVFAPELHERTCTAPWPPGGTCAHCGTDLMPGSGPCPLHVPALAPAEPETCRRCGKPLVDDGDGVVWCETCLERVVGDEEGRA